MTGSLLASAQDSLCLGDYGFGHRQAVRALASARSLADRHHEACALQTLARSSILQSQMRQAYFLATQAAELFHELSDWRSQLEAQCQASYAASAMGMHEIATALADMSVTLAQEERDEQAAAHALNYLGVAAFWTNNRYLASVSLEAAHWHTASRPNRLGGFQTLVNSTFAEFLTVFSESLSWFRTDTPTELGRFDELVRQSRAMAEAGHVSTFNRESTRIGVALLEFLSCQLNLRRHRLVEAEINLARLSIHALKLPRRNWFQALLPWARSDVAFASNNIELAKRQANIMVWKASTSQHVEAARAGKQLLERIHRTQFERNRARQ